MINEAKLPLLYELNKWDLTCELVDLVVGDSIGSLDVQHMSIGIGGKAVDEFTKSLGDDPALASVQEYGQA